jgi:hypothetical protein
MHLPFQKEENNFTFSQWSMFCLRKVKQFSVSLEERRLDVRESRLGKVFSREYIPSSTSICAIEDQLISFKENLVIRRATKS